MHALEVANYLLPLTIISRFFITSLHQHPSTSNPASQTTPNLSLTCGLRVWHAASSLFSNAPNQVGAFQDGLRLPCTPHHRFGAVNKHSLPESLSFPSIPPPPPPPPPLKSFQQPPLILLLFCSSSPRHRLIRRNRFSLAHIQTRSKGPTILPPWPAAMDLAFSRRQAVSHHSAHTPKGVAGMAAAHHHCEVVRCVCVVFVGCSCIASCRPS